MGGKSSKKKSAPEDLPIKSPLEILADGQVVFITSKASGKLLRIHEDKVDALGEECESSQFTVHKKDSESGHVVTLQNGEQYVQISEDQVGLNSTGDELSELKVVEADGGCVAFESVKTASRYISVQENGSVETATELGPSVHFTVRSAAKQEEAAAATGEAEAENKTTEEEEKEEEQTEQEEAVEDKGEQQEPSES